MPASTLISDYAFGTDAISHSPMTWAAFDLMKNHRLFTNGDC